jgi:RimJ/RimL family protein N-acetyltransferase
LLEGRTVNLKIVEREDLPLLTEWRNTPEISGEFMFREQKSRAEAEKEFDNRAPDSKTFFIEKKDGTKIGWIGHFLNGRLLEIYYYLLPSERRKGYGTEAIVIMVDYLFLSRDLTRVQATCDPDNIASQRVLEKAGFKREGIIRKVGYNVGRIVDDCLYGIIREEWKEPKILTKTRIK